jgi:lysophospholipase L1-like esterase
MTVSRSLLLRALPLALILIISQSPRPALAEDPGPPVCAAPKELLQLGPVLPREKALLAGERPVKIVPVGSSSTAGAGASSPAMTYPSRLEAELRGRFPKSSITVLNRGVNGEEARDMLARFDAAVLAEHPDLVLWQVGTNAVLRDHASAGMAPLIEEGLTRLKRSGADVILVDPQFAPKVLIKPDAEKMVHLIGMEAKTADVGLFQRFAIMRHWHEGEGIPFATILSPDELHMNDWSYGCVARVLAEAIGNAVHPAVVAGVPRRAMK